MKKLSFLFLLALLPLMASAYDAYIDGIYYNLIPKGKAAEVTSGDVKYTDNVTIPESFTYNGVTYSVTSIGEGAFDGCSGLTSITIPNSVTSIGSWAFYGCSGLTSITIPNSVTSIGGNAFLGCSSLTSVTIGSGVKSIGSYAFDGCTGLTTISVASGNRIYDSRNNCNAIIQTATNTLVLGCKNTTIPNSVTTIEDNAFKGNSNITSISIPNGVTRIGNSVFTDCSNLKEITIPGSVTSIGSYAFFGCKSLTSIIIPDGVQYIYNNTFSDCTALTSITIPNSVVSIGDYAFDGCRSLSSIDIPNSVTKIGKETFQKCFGLRSVTIGNGIETIEYAAFRDCSGLTSAHIHDLDSWCKIAFSHLYSNPLYFAHHLYLGDKEIDSLIIPDGITSVKSYAFAGFTSLKSVTIPSSVTSMDYRSFGYCSGLTDVYCYAEDAPTIGEAFYNVQTSFVTLHVPEASIETYKKTSPWSGFGTIVAIPDGGLRGDVNGDGVVNGTDIQAVINVIVDGEYDEKADVNEDGNVNGTDIQEVINIIVEGE